VTIIVGVKCTDGVVIGADSVATSSAGPQRLIQIISDDKINIVGGRLIIACTGAVGLSQRFHGVVKAAWEKKLFQKQSAECLREITRGTLQDFDYTGVQRHPPMQGGLQFGSLMAAVLDSTAQLIEFGPVDFQPEIKKDNIHFVSMGSGQVLADPFLAFVSRVLWGGKPPDVKMGSFGLYWVLSHTIQYAPGGVGKPIKIAVLKKEKGEWSARSMEGDDLQESGQHVDQIEKLIAGYPKASVQSAETTQPPVPSKDEDNSDSP
jgi:hypothetical protein